MGGSGGGGEGGGLKRGGPIQVGICKPPAVLLLLCKCTYSRLSPPGCRLVGAVQTRGLASMCMQGCTLGSLTVVWWGEAAWAMVAAGGQEAAAWQEGRAAPGATEVAAVAAAAEE